LLSYLAFFLLLEFLSYTLAYSIAYCLGIVISYFLNARYVFLKSLCLKDFIKYPIVYIVQYGLGVVILRLLVETGGVEPQLGMVFVMLITIPVTFFLSKLVLSSGQNRAQRKCNRCLDVWRLSLTGTEKNSNSR